MTKAETKKLARGIYRLHWKSGGSSLAAVGSNERGDRWIAPTNWINAGSTLHWKLVERAELLMHNDRVEGRDAALSRRVPSHDGLEGNGTGRHE